FKILTEIEFCRIIDQSLSISQINTEQLVEFLTIANFLYREGNPIIEDPFYNQYIAELKRRDPNHLFLNTVEPEPAFFGKTVKLPVKMLSTEKAYSQTEIEQWLNRIQKAAEEMGKDFNSLLIKVTPKLDGYAAYYDGKKLYTRGDGTKGSDISRVLDRGLFIVDETNCASGAGEIVINQSYFEKYLATEFDNSRNFQASIIKEKELTPSVELAIKEKAALFYLFSSLPHWIGLIDQLREQFKTIIEEYWHKVDYEVDGVILEIVDVELKNYMGATRHHHRWQIAYKENTHSAKVKVLSVTPQTSRSGRITPVAELELTKLSGALIQRVTAHHYGMVKECGIAKDAIIQLTRSGEVIPKIEKVLEPKNAQIPEYCPSCKQELIWDANDLYCLNRENCPAQIESSIEHFFHTLGNIDGFGEKIIEKLNANGISTVYEVYSLTLERLMTMGFGEKTSQNLLTELERSRTEPIEDWRFFGAFGIDRMGLGNCERLLQKYTLYEIFDLTVENMANLQGFDKTAQNILKQIHLIKEDFENLLKLGFNLTESKVKSLNNSPIFNKLLVFTGTMKTAKRADMVKEAKNLGAKISTNVSSKTDYLIIGEKPTDKKLQDAQNNNIKIITEEKYLKLINKNNSENALFN
ncbi:MAG: ligase, partial [Pseudomonadota bacterium]